jgi:hypothetical protein
LTPVFSRYEGTFETIFFFSSVYELIDFRTYLFQYTGGFNRYIRPKCFNSFIIIPDELKNYEWTPGKKLDWGNTGAYFLLIENMNQVKYVIPSVLNPVWKLESLNDSSTKFGGDQIAEYKMSASWKYEICLPTYMLLSNRVGDCKVNYNFSMSKVYTKYDWQPPYEILKSISKKVSELQIDLSKAREFEIKNKTIEPIIELENSILNPKPEELIQWNPIVSGKLIEVIDTSTIVTKNDIIYFDNFNDYYLPQLRLCKAAVSRRGSYSSSLIIKSRLLNKSVLINSNIYDLISPYFNTQITIDTLNEKIYSGIIETREIDKSESHFGRRVLNILKLKNTKEYEEAIESSKLTPLADTVYEGLSDKKILIGKGNGDTTVFETNMILPERYNIYIDNGLTLDYTVTDNTTIVFNNAPKLNEYVFYCGTTMFSQKNRMIAVYEYTKEDETKDNIYIDFPLTVNSEDLIVNSYYGILKEGIDWILNTEDNTLNLINVRAKKGELVEIFNLVKDE